MEPTPPPSHPFSDSPPPPLDPPPPSSLPAEQSPRPRPGRPLRLTREVLDAIVSAVEQGSYLKIAAQAAGVGQSTLAAWLARGRVAASLIADHAEDRLYCPVCGRDRTEEVEFLREEQQRLDDAYEVAREQHVDGDPEPEQAGVALDRCPSPECRTDLLPEEWTLPEEEAPFLELLDSVTRAQASAETAAVAAWKRAFTGHDPDWRAARDFLARTAPERWAGVTRVQMTTEEAERRIDDAVNEALLAIGVDLPADEADLALDEPGESLDA